MDESYFNIPKDRKWSSHTFAEYPLCRLLYEESLDLEKDISVAGQTYSHIIFKSSYIHNVSFIHIPHVSQFSSMKGLGIFISCCLRNFV
ncbi:unnamed protein product [Sphenostylis stenocarpa]|uniref:Uncharacterized protein n=1 Tax=Sphenostylis stenocarpa TaxID=92480 RepID=A0AA86V308_9FABA|nr:unnamed protein product [Sphenostylis stenocarpa]